jgi:hypothetical protein
MLIYVTILESGIEDKFEDTKGVIRICKSKKDRPHNDHRKKGKGTNNDLQNIHIKLNIGLVCVAMDR